MEKYYLLSLKHTNRKDDCFTFWRGKETGYAWFKGWAGIYTKEQALRIADDVSTVAFPVELVDPLFVPAVYEGTPREVVPINPATLAALELFRAQLQEKNKTTFGIEFL